jgi:putative hydrolase of the HAD superfamily
MVASNSLILFDFGGTLDADGERWCVRFHRAYQGAGGALPLEDFEQQFRRSDRLLEVLDGIREMDFSGMVRAQAALLRGLVPDAGAVQWDRVADAFRCDALAAVERNRPLIERLATRHPLGIVSNFTGNLEHCLRELGLRPLFRVVADSAIIGTSKPNAAIFEHALAAAGATPKGSWMVGDNFEADIRPAAALGFSTAWLAEPARALPAPGIATARIGRLAELEPLVG